MADAILHINADNFDHEIVDSGSPVLLDFYATWCGPCKTIAPIVEGLAEQYADQGLKVGKVDIDTAADLATKFGIQGVPTLIFFKGGEKVDQLVGAHSQKVIEEKVKGIL